MINRARPEEKDDQGQQGPNDKTHIFAQMNSFLFVFQLWFLIYQIFIVFQLVPFFYFRCPPLSSHNLCSDFVYFSIFASFIVHPSLMHFHGLYFYGWIQCNKAKSADIVPCFFLPTLLRFFSVFYVSVLNIHFVVLFIWLWHMAYIGRYHKHILC